MARHCKNCSQPGHYTPRCPQTKIAQSILATPIESSGRSLKEIGRAIIEKEQQVVPREPDMSGTIPSAGLWLVNVDRKRVAGKISQVKKDGTILWTDCWNCLIESSSAVIKAGGYRYLDLQAPHLLFEVTNKTMPVIK